MADGTAAAIAADPTFDLDQAIAEFKAAGEQLRAEKERRRRKPEPPDRRTLQRVRRDSKMAGDEVWRPLTRKEANDNINAVKRLQRRVQMAGKKAGGESLILSTFDSALYELLANCAVRWAGKVEPTLEWLSEKMTGFRTRTKTVHRGLKRLAFFKLIEWDRRLVIADGAGHARGPQVEQTSNAYRILDIPGKLLALIGIRKAPPPEDASWRAEQASADNEEHHRQWREDQHRRAEAASPSLARATAKAAAATALASAQRDGTEDSQTG